MSSCHFSARMHHMLQASESIDLAVLKGENEMFRLHTSRIYGVLKILIMYKHRIIVPLW